MDVNALTRRSFLGLAVGTAAASLLSGCGEFQEEERPSSYRLGGIGPNVDGAKRRGGAAKCGGFAAIDQLNEKEDYLVELVWLDDEDNPKDALGYYNSLKDWGLDVLIGPTTEKSAIAVAAETNADRVFQISPNVYSIEALGGTELGASVDRRDNVFQMGSSNEDLGAMAAQLAAEQKLGTRAAVIYCTRDASSSDRERGFSRAAEAQGLELVCSVGFDDTDTKEFSEQLAAAQDAGADVVFLPLAAAQAALVIRQAAEEGYTPHYVGTKSLDGILGVSDLDKQLVEGLAMLLPYDKNATDPDTLAFVKNYQFASGTTELPPELAARGYDCVKAVVKACVEAGIHPDTPPDEMCEGLIRQFSSPDFSYTGLTGTYHWSASGTCTVSPKGVIIQDGAYVPV